MRYSASSTICSLILFLLSCVLSPQAGAQIKVVTANPNSAAQGTVNLDVIVSGSGFKKGAAAKWFVTGTTNPGGVTVNSTAFNSDSQLTANITVSSTAVIGSFDIQVTNTDGRSGKGTELFAVAQGSNNAKSSPTSVTSILNDTGEVVDGTNYRVQSDSISPDYHDAVNGVSSIFQASLGDWVLDTTSSTSRGVLIDLRAPVPGSTTNPPFGGFEIVPTRIIVVCSVTLSGSFEAMSLDQTLSCPGSLSFTYGGTEYALKMTSNSLEPETNKFLVTCTATSSGHCSAWTLNPITQPNGTVENIARLEKGTSGPKFISLGDFYVTFAFSITNP